jgi:SNF2 family DNA or RNA helicase
MIRQKAIDEFLQRPRRDYREYKKLTSVDLNNRILLLPKRPPIWNRLRHHQRVCFIIGTETKRFFFINDMGTGKTLLAIALCRYFEKLGVSKCNLVLVPRRANKWEWRREIRKHSMASHCVLHGSSKAKWERLRNGNALFFIDTYMGFVRMLCTLTPGRRGKNKLQPDRELVQEAMQKFQGLIADESTCIQNNQRLPFRICRQLAKSAQIVFPLTGTPFGRDPTSLWTQLFIVDGGETLGETLGLYRAAFFRSKMNYWGGMEYTFEKKKEGLLHRLLANRSIRYASDEAELPDVSEFRKYVSLPHDAREYYRIAKEAVIKARGNYQESKNAFMRMRQISSGFLGYKDDETGEKSEFEFAENPKLDLLLAMIEEARPDWKLIVFTEFIHSGERIAKELAKLKIKHQHLYGKTKDPQATLALFDKDAETRVLILNNSMGMGLNLQVANVGIYYESPVSAMMREQTRRRFVRQGSPHDRVFLYDLVSRGTVDERILTFHKEGRDLLKAIVDGKIEL